MKNSTIFAMIIGMMFIATFTSCVKEEAPEISSSIKTTTKPKTFGSYTILPGRFKAVELIWIDSTGIPGGVRWEIKYYTSYEGNYKMVGPIGTTGGQSRIVYLPVVQDSTGNEIVLVYMYYKSLEKDENKNLVKINGRLEIRDPNSGIIARHLPGFCLTDEYDLSTTISAK